MSKRPVFERARTAKEMRLDEAREEGAPWKQWGPYVSERQWGTVREDYGEDGDAWNYFTHDQARSRAYHWAEDGLAGFSDDHQRLCFAMPCGIVIEPPDVLAAGRASAFGPPR